jgi:hypothetical protein
MVESAGLGHALTMAAREKKAAAVQPTQGRVRKHSTRPPSGTSSARPSIKPPPPPEEPAPATTSGVASSEFVKKWGPTIAKYGYTMVPNALLEGQRRLGISDAGLVVLLNLLKHWREKESRVFPSQATLGASMGKASRSVQRALDNIEKLIAVSPRRYATTGNFNSNEYTFDALIAELTPIARDMQEKQDEARALRAKAQKPGLRRRRAPPKDSEAP